jgi:hypothetical protein
MTIDDEINDYTRQADALIRRIPELANSLDQSTSSSLIVVLGIVIGGLIGFNFVFPVTILCGLAGAVFGALCSRGISGIKLEKAIKKSDAVSKHYLDQLNKLPDNAPDEIRRTLYSQYEKSILASGKEIDQCFSTNDSPKKILRSRRDVNSLFGETSEQLRLDESKEDIV